MLALEIPSVEFLKQKGKFFGYADEGYYELWRLGKLLYMIVDGFNFNKEWPEGYWRYVELYKHRPNERFWAGFHPFDGMPCLKEP